MMSVSIYAKLGNSRNLIVDQYVSIAWLEMTSQSCALRAQVVKHETHLGETIKYMYDPAVRRNVFQINKRDRRLR